MSNQEKENKLGERLFSYLITTYYHHFRELKGWPYGKLKIEPVVRFGGFVLKEPYWNEEKKRVEIERGFHKREPLLVMGEDFPIPTSTIYLNELFLYHQLGLRNYYEEKVQFKKLFDFSGLTYVLAHEIVHAILADFFPEEEEHGKLHKMLVEELEEFIKSSPEYQELKKFWR